MLLAGRPGDHRRGPCRINHSHDPNKHHEKTHHPSAGGFDAGCGGGRPGTLRDHPRTPEPRTRRRSLHAEKHHGTDRRGPGYALPGGGRGFRPAGAPDNRLRHPVRRGTPPQPHHPAAGRRAGRRGLPADGRPVGGMRGGLRRTRGLLRHPDPLPAPAGRNLRRHARPGRALAGPLLPDRGRAPLPLPRDDARRRALFPARGERQKVHRSDGHAQAEHVPLAPDRGSGLAHRDPEVSPADGDRVVAPRDGRLRPTADSTRRTTCARSSNTHAAAT